VLILVRSPASLVL